jgi:hypothetical protein
MSIFADRYMIAFGQPEEEKHQPLPSQRADNYPGDNGGGFNFQDIQLGAEPGYP